MRTYIIESQGLYKIGKSKDLEGRLCDYRTHNPKFELIHVLQFDCEKFLHAHFYTKHFNLEWFYLTEEDIEWIKANHELLSQNTYEILESRRKEEERVIREEKKRERKRKKEITRMKEVLRMQLEDKATEEWLLRRIAECPDCFSR